MEQRTAQVRLDGTNNQAVVVRELSWEEDVKCWEEAQEKFINQQTGQVEQQWDAKKLQLLRLSTATGIEPAALRKMPRRDVEQLFRVYRELNELGDAEKSSPVGGAQRQEPAGSAAEERDRTDVVAGTLRAVTEPDGGTADKACEVPSGEATTGSTEDKAGDD